MTANQRLTGMKVHMKSIPCRFGSRLRRHFDKMRWSCCTDEKIKRWVAGDTSKSETGLVGVFMAVVWVT